MPADGARLAWRQAWRCLRNCRYQDYGLLPPPARALYLVAFRLWRRAYLKQSMTPFNRSLGTRLRAFKANKHRRLDPQLPF